jgi:REP element-mobilizing transposase RayT
MGGIVREYGEKLLGVGGTENHVHLLLSLPSTLSTAQTIQLIKGGSSHWIHETFSDRNRFAWQEGYGAFSIGISHQEKTLRYIQNQETHHRTMTFEEEYRAFLQRHEMDFDEKYVFG